MIYGVIIFSILFESVITNIVNMNSILIPLFLLTSLSILYPYFKGNNSNFIISSIICGFIYDISFADSTFINTISFGICSLFIILCYNYFKYSIYSANIINILDIVIYRFITYILLVVIDYTHFNYNTLFKGIYSSIIINIIYGIVIYLFTDVISRMYNIKKD